MNIFSGKKSIAVKVSVLVVSFVFAFSILFLAFPAKAFATTDENDVSAEETTSNEEDISQADDTSNSDVVIEDEQDQADSASDAEINSEDEEASQDQESTEGQSEGTDDESSISNDDSTPNSIEGEENADEEDIASTEETPNEDAGTVEGEQVQSDDSLNSDEDVVDESESAFEEVEEQAVETPEINIDILFSTDEDGYISAGEETNFSIDITGVDIAECYWDFGDGSDSLDKNPNYTYKKDGNYTQTITIVDSEGNSYSKTTTVHVSDHNPDTTEWYVSPNATSNAGDFEDGNSSENPVSIGSVLSHIVDGDTLYFLSGTYTGTYTEDKDSNISLDNIGTGTEDNPISFVGYDQAIFDGGNTIDHAFSLTSPLSYLGFYNFTFINYLDSAIYIDNQEVTNIDVVDNTFADNGTAIDVAMDSDLNIQNNTVVDNSIGIDVSSDNANVEHNIVVDNNQGIKVDSTKDNVTVDYNDVYNNQIDYIGTEPGENDISVDPMFVDKEALDFSLQEDSPLVNNNIIRIVQTDKEDYRYNEQVIITGSGYGPKQELILKILRPDGTFVEDIAVTTDINGSFAYDGYSVDYAGKNYLIKITDTDGNILEVLSFTDKTITVDTSKSIEGDNYHTIQDAINASNDGDTINVAGGTYYEHLIIDKSNIRLIGEDKETTIIDATQDSSWLIAKAGILVGEYPLVDGVSGVTISNFTIQNAVMQEGGVLYGGDSYGVGPGGKCGIQIYNSNSNTIENNIFINNYWQIWIVAESPAAGYTECKNNSIVNNIIRDSNQDGVYLYSDGGVYIEDTIITGNDIYNVSGDYSSGIEFRGWPEGGDTPTIKNTVIKNNSISNCIWGIRIGPNVWDASETKIKNNSISNCTWGIKILDKKVEDITGTEIKENNIAGNSFGVDNCYSFWWDLMGNVRTTINATNNWWGDASGPEHASNPGGTGDAVSDNVDYSPWLTNPVGYVPPSPPAEEPPEEEPKLKPKPKPWERTDIGYYEKTDTGFTTLFYSRFFRRPPDQAGLDSWVAWLESGAITGAELVNGFIFGEECQARISNYTNEEFITFLYRVLFNREPGTDSYNAWLDRMSAGMTKEEVVDRFTHSEEFVNFCTLFGIVPYESYIGTEE